MLRIPCPFCGVRDQTEFHCGGEAGIVRPAEPAVAGDEAWADYLFYRDNVKGLHVERWVHRYGCRQWFLVERDTVTHEIRGSRALPNARGASVPSSGSAA